jgi:hypothetical protein
MSIRIAALSPVKTLLMLILSGVLHSSSATAACPQPCGCNPAPTVSAGPKPTITNLPTQTIEISTCCDPNWPGDVNQDGVVDTLDYLYAIGLNPAEMVGTDTDSVLVKTWEQTDCVCSLKNTPESVDDPVLVDWTGMIDACTPGTYTLTATARNPDVVERARGGSRCVAKRPDGTCLTEQLCNKPQDYVPWTTIESEVYTIYVEVLDLGTCATCQPDSVTWECNNRPSDCQAAGCSPCNEPYLVGDILGYCQTHRFAFWLDGVPAGRGLTMLEEVEMTVAVHARFDSSVLIADIIVPAPNSPRVRDEGIVCVDSCPGSGAAVVGDLYRGEANVNFGNAGWIACQTNPNWGHDILRVTFTHQWDQSVYIKFWDYIHNLGSFHSAIALRASKEFTWPSGNCSSISEGSWSTPIVVYRTGNI